jgi:hypothetical protein
MQMIDRYSRPLARARVREGLAYLLETGHDLSQINIARIEIGSSANGVLGQLHGDWTVFIARQPHMTLDQLISLGFVVTINEHHDTAFEHERALLNIVWKELLTGLSARQVRRHGVDEIELA